ncbi:MAG: hypothetical protein KH353_12060, partial [Clostridium sp.]|nr:hypothetical protein [Clostridium sp.]
YGEFCVVTLFYQTAIDHVYFYEIEFAKLIIRYLPSFLFPDNSLHEYLQQLDRMFNKPSK